MVSRAADKPLHPYGQPSPFLFRAAPPTPGLKPILRPPSLWAILWSEYWGVSLERFLVFPCRLVSVDSPPHVQSAGRSDPADHARTSCGFSGCLDLSVTVP